VIVGIGVDVVDVGRVRKSLDRFGDRFAGKVLSEAERARFGKSRDKAAWLAKRFAAKEAAAKALGTGMRAGVHFSQITVARKSSGAPLIELSGAAAERAATLGAGTMHVSISDEKDYAVAFVVLEGLAD
jgi:holo-[acyl-carrier protein] synthase